MGTIYVYYPRWNLMAISKYLDTNEYKLNQYSINNRLPIALKENDKIDKDMPRMHVKPKATKKMKQLKWRKIRKENIPNSIFVKINKNEDVRLDFELLHALWSI